MRWEGNLTHKAETKKCIHNFWKGSFGNLGADGRIFNLLSKKYNVQTWIDSPGSGQDPEGGFCHHFALPFNSFLVYLTTMSVTQIVKCQITGWQ